MQIISFLMSTVMMLTSLFLPVSGMKTENVQAASEASFFSEEAEKVLPPLIENIINEARTGTSDSQEALDLINSLPVHENGEERTERKTVKANPVKIAISEAAKSLVNKVVPDGTINHFLNHLTNGMYDIYAYFVPVTGEENVYYIYCDYVNNYNEPNVVFTGIKYNMETGKLYGEDNNGLMGIGFDYDAKNYTITTPVNVCMRDMGYSVFYDIFGGLGFMDTDTVRVKFEHGGKHWMFQFWKGAYGFGLLNGAELGIYNKTNEYAVSYNCASDEEMLVMSTTLSSADEILVEREEKEHWWMCGFRFGPGMNPEDLTMESKVQFKDEAMMSAFLEAVEEYSDEMTITVDGMKVSVIWQ